MGRTLVQVGLALAAVAVWTLLAGNAGWIPKDGADLWGATTLKAGLACAAVGLILKALAPVGRKVRVGRCARCGKATDRGQVYCRDHMKQALDEIRDQMSRTQAHGRSARS